MYDDSLSLLLNHLFRSLCGSIWTAFTDIWLGLDWTYATMQGIYLF